MFTEPGMSIDSRIAVVTLGVAWFAAACSSLEVRDTYVATETNSFVIFGVSRKDVSLRAAINPRTRMASFGVMGVPIVPTVVQSSAREIRLELTLTSTGPQEFSFLGRPCLILNDQNSECPYELELTALARLWDDGSMNKNGQLRWLVIFGDIGGKPHRLVPSSAERIDKARVYQLYDHSGTAKFDNLIVTVTYKFRCGDRCPERFSLDTADLVVLNNEAIGGQVVHLEHRRETDYQAITPVQ